MLQPNLPEQPCLGQDAQVYVDFQSLNGGFTGNSSVFILNVPRYNLNQPDT